MPDKASRFTFTAKKLEHLKPPSFLMKAGRQIVQQQYYWQGDGLGFCLSSTGTRSWVFTYRLHNRSRRDVLGPYSATPTADGKHLTLRQANEKAEEYRAWIRQGKDPRHVEHQQEQEQRAADANTFLACAERFLKLYRPKNKPQFRPRALNECRRHLLVDFKSLHALPISSITKRDVNQALDQIQERIKGSGINNCLKTVRKMFHWAMERAEIDLPPTAGIGKRAPDITRTRHLFGNPEHNKPCEIALLWHAADAIGTAGALPKLLLLTAQRRNEVANMTWDELLDLDGDNPRWLIPADRAKNWKENLVPLSPTTVAIIKRLPRIVGCRYVLTSDGKTPRSGFSDLKEAMDAAVQKIRAEEPAKYSGQLEQPWVFHDLRRTAKTGMAALGIPGEIRDAIFNHAPVQRMDQVYVHASYSEEKRKAVERWAAWLSRVISGKSTQENVVPITRRKG